MNLKGGEEVYPSDLASGASTQTRKSFDVSSASCGFSDYRIHTKRETPGGAEHILLGV